MGEKVAVPSFLAKWYEETNAGESIYGVLNNFNEEKIDVKVIEFGNSCKGRNRNNFSNAQEVIARMYLDGYEAKEKLYVVALESNIGLIKDIKTELTDLYDELPYDYKKLTEKDIKDFDERYWAFAKEIENER